MGARRNVQKALSFSWCFSAPRVQDSVMPAEDQIPGPAVVHDPAATTASSQPSRRRSSSESELRKFAATQTASRKSDQGSPTLTTQTSLIQRDMQALLASNINRQYTDEDWFAAMAALGKVKQMQQQRALQQLHINNKPSLQDDDVWYSPRSRTISTASAAFISDIELSEVCKLAHDIELQERQQQQLTLSPGRELAAPTPSCVPTTPLLYAGKDWKFCPVDVKPFCFYWARDELRSTSAPLPIDEQQKLGTLGHKIHQSIAGSWFRDYGDQLVMHITPLLPGIPTALTKYTEYYNKDQTPSSWSMRRDIKVGRTVGQMFMTTDGILILRVCAYGLFSSKVEWVNEDYIRLEDNGETVVTRQVCKVMADNSVQSQFIVGRKAGTAPPKR